MTVAAGFPQGKQADFPVEEISMGQNSKRTGGRRIETKSFERVSLFQSSAYIWRHHSCSRDHRRCLGNRDCSMVSQAEPPGRSPHVRLWDVVLHAVSLLRSGHGTVQHPRHLGQFH